MSQDRPGALPAWTLAGPVAATLVLMAAAGGIAGAWMTGLTAAALIVAVLAAVHHAEVVAHRVGEPFGTLILALAVTVIEVSLIFSVMLSGGAGADALARDTVFAAIMIVCNGVVGLCLLVGALRHHVLVFQVDGTVPALSVLAALGTLTLVLPDFTTTTRGPTFSTAQLAFAGIASLLLYGAFVFVQTVRHRDYFLPIDTDSEKAHAAPPTTKATAASAALLMVCLALVVGLAKMLSPAIKAVVTAAAAPPAVVGVAIAFLVLLPETMAATRAAARNRMQTSFNLALGSALATIGLTIPVVAAASVALGLPLTLGLSGKDTVLFAITMLASALTLGSGRATVLQGAVHLVLFAAFLFLAVVP